MSDRAAARSVPPRSTAAARPWLRGRNAPRTTPPRTTTVPTATSTPRPPELSAGHADRDPASPTAGRSLRRTRTQASSRRAPFVLLVVALLVGTTLGLLVLNTAIAVDSLKATQLRAENAERAQEVQRLEQQRRLRRHAGRRSRAPPSPPGWSRPARPPTSSSRPTARSTLRGTPEPAGDPAAEPTDGD